MAAQIAPAIRIALLSSAFLCAGAPTAPANAHAPKLTVLYRFSQSQNGEADPESTPVALAGSLYGTVAAGGSTNGGTIFRFDLATLVETTLYSFPGGNKQGSTPTGPLSRFGTSIFGSTTQGHGTGPGSNGNYTGYGTIWKLNTHGDKYQLLHGFDGKDGSQPYSGVTRSSGKFYGVTWYGGPSNAGTIFTLERTGELTQLYSFPEQNIGCNPLDSVTLVGTFLYGTTTFCGANSAGTVYVYNLDTNKASVLHSFAANPNGSAQPSALVYQNGALYGTTFDDGGAGDVYKIVLKTGKYKVVHQFSGGADGGTPSSALTLFHGKLYGVTEAGGASDAGTIYSIDPASDVQAVAYSFKAGTDGDTPFAGLLAHGDALYGTTLNLQSEYPNIRGALFQFNP